MKTINKLIKSTIIYCFSTLIGQGMSFLGIVVFTRLMSKTDYGNYMTYYAYVSIFTVLVGANLFYALNNAYIDKKDDINEFKKSIIVLSGCIALIALIIAEIIGAVVLKKYTYGIIFLGIIHAYGFFVITYRIYAANMENDYKKKALLIIFPNTFQFFFSLGMIYLIKNSAFEARVLGSSLGISSIASIAFVGLMLNKGRLLHFEYWKYALSISIPTILMSLSYMLMQQCDKVMIERILGPDETAVYSVIYYLGYSIMAIDQAAAPVRQAWIFRSLDKNNYKQIKMVQKWYLLFLAFLSSIVILVGPEAIKILTPHDYWQFEYVVPFVFSAFMMMLYRFYTEIILFYKKNIALSFAVTFCAVINILLNYLWIPNYGAVSACYSTVISYAILFLLAFMIASREKPGIYSFKMFLIFLFEVLASAFIFYKSQNIFTVRLLFMFAILVINFIFVCTKRTEVKQILLRGEKKNEE